MTTVYFELTTCADADVGEYTLEVEAELMG